MMSRGTFIVIEGGEGAGKDANIELLKRDFSGKPIVWVKDPGGTELSNRLREVVAYGENLARETELFLFLAARAQLVHEVIAPALARGEHVIANRFDLSTMAYQVYGRERLDFKEPLMAISRMARGEAVPDAVILLDVPPQSGLIRAASRKEKTTRFEAEALAFHSRVREGYITHIKDYASHVLIDASAPLADVYEKVRNEVERHIGQ